METSDQTSYPGMISPPANPASGPPGYGERPLPPGPIHPGSGRRINWRKLFAPLGAAALFLAKIAAKLKALLILLPKIKLLTTSGTMLVSVAAYSLIWGWRFAVGFVVLIFVHEMGHVIQLRREGIKASAPMFIPFMGAVIWSKSLGDNAYAEAKVGLAGPILGSLGAAALIPVADATGNELFRALAFTGFFLNLFNLLPVVPLDGGRAMAALSPWMWLVGFAALLALVFAFPNPIMILILLFGAMETWRRWQTRNAPGAAEYYRVEPYQRLLIAAVYIALIALLAFGMSQTHVPRNFGDA
jgi:Zn-dependent protease